jgi:hypothetical protein
MLATDGTLALDEILSHVRSGAPHHEDRRLVEKLVPRLRAKEKEISGRAKELARKLQRAIGRGRPLTDVGDKVATPLQTQRQLVAGVMS